MKKTTRRIFLTDTDLERLERLIEAVPDSPYVRALDEELANAITVPQNKIPPDVVTMNSKVRFEDVFTGKEQIVTLTYPEDAEASEGRVSILAPVGSALLGLSTGQFVEWPIPGGKVRSLKITEVLYQPEAAGNYDL